jgi:hypothetical protein
VDIEKKEEKSSFCYKVVTCDKNDEIVHVQASVMVGAAVEVSMQQKHKTKWQGELGILSNEECKQFTEALKEL